jgi:hypothetical protein
LNKSDRRNKYDEILLFNIPPLCVSDYSSYTQVVGLFYFDINPASLFDTQLGRCILQVNQLIVIVEIEEEGERD